MASSTSDRKNIIVDTDMFSDVDDAAAVMLALTHPKANLLAVMTNYPSSYSVLAASALIGYYSSKPAPVPIGARGPLKEVAFVDTYDSEHGDYVYKLAYHWRDLPGAPLAWGKAEDACDPVRLYRKVLAGLGEGERVTVISIGFLANINGLLESQPDDISSRTGSDLTAEKIAEIVIMGGEYPSGREFNFSGDNPRDTSSVVGKFGAGDGGVRLSTPLIFSGFEMGKNVLTGSKIMDLGMADPVGAAYKWYTHGKPRESWDTLTVLYAIEGVGDLFAFGNETGFNRVGADGSNRWVDDEAVTNQHWLKLRVDPAKAAEILDELYLEGARMGASRSRDGAK